MKKRILSFVLLLTVLSCQENFKYEKQKKDDLKKVSMTSLDRESQLTQVLDQIGAVQIGGSHQARTQSTAYEIVTDSILKVLQPDSIHYSYTFKVSGEDDGGAFENLVLKKIESGYLAFILRYEPTGGVFTGMATFNGAIKRYDLSGTLLYETHLNDQTTNGSATNGRVSSTCLVKATLELANVSTATGLELPDYLSEWVLTLEYGECDEGGGGGSSSGGGTYVPDPIGTGGGGGAGSGGGSSSGGSSGSGSGSSDGGSSSSGSGPSDGTGGTEEIGVLPKVVAAQEARATDFVNNLSESQSVWLENENTNNAALVSRMFDYLESQLTTVVQKQYSTEAKDFVTDLIDLAVEENNSELSDKLMSIALIVEEGGYLTNSLDANFYSQIDPYVDLDLTTTQDFYDPLTTYLVVKSAILRAEHPDWSDAKVIWEAMRDVVHTGLDIFGLVPVLGEAADLTNGLLYTLEGDYLNAGFSAAAAVPIVGASSTISKYSLKIINSATDITSKVKLVWKSSAEGIYFGSDGYCRSQLRKVLGLAVGDARQAHHIIPLNQQTHDVIQKAAQSSNAFHMNEALNGIPLDNTIIHNGSHPRYDLNVRQRLDAIDISKPADEVYDKLMKVIDDITTVIQNNSNTPINQLVF